ncbi:MAG: DUF4249 domain-containing protein [Flavobacteriales bacterium]
MSSNIQLPFTMNTYKTRIQKSLLIAIPALLMGMQSCQKVIEIELEEAERQVVIDGGVYEGDDHIRVRISKTTSFFDTSSPEGIGGAVVSVTMPDGAIVPLNDGGNGYYTSGDVVIANNGMYALKVETGNKTYTASSYMSPSLPLDTLEYEFQEAQFGGDPGYNVFLVFQDQSGKDFYRIVTKVNGELMNEPSDILVFDDNLNDGNLIRIPVFTRLFEPGDTVEAELQVLDPDLYEFYQTFAAVASEDAGSPFSAAPANPETNIVGGALGVWGAYTSSKKTVVLPL